MGVARVAAVGLAVAAVAVSLLLAAGLGAAVASGYDLSFSQGVTVPVKDAALLDFSTYDAGGTNLTVSLTVQGTFVLNNSAYVYSVFFGGGAEDNSTAYVVLSNNSTAGTYFSLASENAPTGAVPFSLSNGNSELTFELAKSVVGPSTDFVANAFAVASVGSSEVSSYLGSFYPNGGGVCTGSICSSATPPAPFDWWTVIVPVVVVVAAIAIVVVLLTRRPKAPPARPAAATAPTPAASAPPPPPRSGGP
jgi:hypothetical protein